MMQYKDIFVKTETSGAELVEVITGYNDVIDVIDNITPEHAKIFYVSLNGYIKINDDTKSNVSDNNFKDPSIEESWSHENNTDTKADRNSVDSQHLTKFVDKSLNANCDDDKSNGSSKLKQRFKGKCVNDWSNYDVRQWFNSLPKQLIKYKVYIFNYCIICILNMMIMIVKHTQKELPEYCLLVYLLMLF
mmetsp:Transcript_24364/g.29749  ORF Transcript_24364/g.29749 Transcript_24364/m.29749 type:complete len:190 (+) Transcript_24364:219-788(+)